ncbi:MAG: RNA polymerase sigma factor [Anaerolineales bacterium]|nr:RNA polymerase sigma factor [Anaerolineales bacterium]
MNSHWLEQCREGDSLAIEKMVHTYQKDVYRLALSILEDPDEAEDSTQETFLAALRAISSFREDAAFKTWLFSITINVCRSRLQRGKTRGRLQQILQSLFHLRDEVEHPEKTAMQNQADAEIWNALRRLDEKHRIPIVLRYYHDLPITDIARMLNIPPGTVHSRLNHAREKLRAYLKEEPR